jgi:hypothetical protein
MRFAICLAVLLALCDPAVGTAQGLGIDHKNVECIVAGKHPRMPACFSPAGRLSRGRVYFRPPNVATWYYVEMKDAAPCHEGVLPKPSKKLVGQQVAYYVEATDQAHDVGRTAEFATLVVRSAEECKTRLVAPFFDKSSAAVFPAIPPGFAAAGGVPAAAVVGAGVAAAGGAAAVMVSRGGDDDGAAAATTTPPSTAPPQTVPATTVPPTPTTTRSAIGLSCTATPRSGQAPLRVEFQPFPTGGTGVYAFEWTFGDGGTSNQVSPAYVYSAPGEFLAVVVVTSGGQTARCERSITVTPAPAPPPPTTTPAPCTATVNVTLSGTGAGTVTSGPAGISCPGDCTESGITCGSRFALTATAPGGSVFVAWSPATPGCPATVQPCIADTSGGAVTIDARFDRFPLTVQPVAGPSSPPPRWTSDLESPGASGRVALNGGAAAAVGAGRTEMATAPRPGVNHVEAVLTEVRRPGTWRFELPAGVEPGSVEPLEGEVVAATGSAVVFRVRGRAGERLSFTFRTAAE